MDLSLFDVWVDPVMVVNHWGDLIYANPAASALWGVSNHHRLIRQGKNLKKHLPGFESLQIWSMLPELQGASPYEEVVVTLKQETHHWQVTFQPLPDSPGLFLIFVRNVSLEKQLQEKYQNQLKQKDDLIRQLNQTNQALTRLNRELEQRVIERVKQWREVHDLMQKVLENVDVGIILVNPDGRFAPVMSQKAQTWIDSSVGQSLANFATFMQKIAPEKPGFYQKWWDTFQTHLWDWESLMALLPSKGFLAESQVHLKLRYLPMNPGSDGGNPVMMIIIEDVTWQIQFENQQKEAQMQAECESRFIQNPVAFEWFEKFVLNWKKNLATACSDAENALRQLHTLKGALAQFGLKSLAQKVHEIEGHLLEGTGSNALLDEFWAQWDRWHRQWQQSPVYQAWKKRSESVVLSHQEWECILSRLPAIEAQSWRLRVLTQDWREVFQPLEWVWRQTLEAQQKPVGPIEWMGSEDLRLWVEPLKDWILVLGHLVRNAAVHGIESPEVRVARGKPPHGLLHIEARWHKPQESWMLIMGDDGQGLPSEIQDRLRGAVTGRLPSRLAQAQLEAGRGFGLWEVFEISGQLGIQIHWETNPGHGTRWIFHVPWFNPVLRTYSDYQTA